MLWVAIIGGIVLTAAFIVIGATNSGATPSSVTVATSSPAEDCARACANWIRMRDQTRQALAEEARILAEHNAKAAEYWRLVAQVAVLLAAAGVASAIPIVGGLVAAAMFAVAASLTAYSLVVLGQLIGHLDNYRRAQEISRDAAKNEADALSQLRTKCPEAEQAKCTAMP